MFKNETIKIGEGCDVVLVDLGAFDPVYEATKKSASTHAKRLTANA